MTTCIAEHYPRLGSIAWALSILFDSAVFLGTYLRLRTTAKGIKTVSQLRNQKWSLEANLLYFGTSCALNIACFVSILAVKDAGMSHTASAIAMTHHCIIATRLVFSAKGWAKRMVQDEELVLNTFNRKARARMFGLTYTVDETIMVGSKAGEEDPSESMGQPGPSGRRSVGPSYPNTPSRAHPADARPGSQMRVLRRGSHCSVDDTPPPSRLSHHLTDPREGLERKRSLSNAELERNMGSPEQMAPFGRPNVAAKRLSSGDEYESPDSSQSIPSYFLQHPFRSQGRNDHDGVDLRQYREDDEIASLPSTHNLALKSSCSTLLSPEPEKCDSLGQDP